MPSPQANQKDSLETDDATIREGPSVLMDSFDSSLSSSSSGRAEVYRPEEQIVGFTSAFLSRGRSAGYGLYFSKTRIIGVRKRRVTIAFGIACAVPLTALLSYLKFVLRLSEPFYPISFFYFRQLSSIT